MKIKKSVNKYRLLIDYKALLIRSSTSPSSGYLLSELLENINSSPTFTSNTPPDEGSITNSLISFLCSFNTFLARATALSI